MAPPYSLRIRSTPHVQTHAPTHFDRRSVIDAPLEPQSTIPAHHARTFVSHSFSSVSLADDLGDLSLTISPMPRSAIGDQLGARTRRRGGALCGGRASTEACVVERMGADASRRGARTRADQLPPEVSIACRLAWPATHATAHRDAHSSRVLTPVSNAAPSVLAVSCTA